MQSHEDKDSVIPTQNKEASDSINLALSNVQNHLVGLTECLKAHPQKNLFAYYVVTLARKLNPKNFKNDKQESIEEFKVEELSFSEIKKYFLEEVNDNAFDKPVEQLNVIHAILSDWNTLVSLKASFDEEQLLRLKKICCFEQMYLLRLFAYEDVETLWEKPNTKFTINTILNFPDYHFGIRVAEKRYFLKLLFDNPDKTENLHSIVSWLLRYNLPLEIYLPWSLLLTKEQIEQITSVSMIILNMSSEYTDAAKILFEKLSKYNPPAENQAELVLEDVIKHDNHIACNIDPADIKDLLVIHAKIKKLEGYSNFDELYEYTPELYAQINNLANAKETITTLTTAQLKMLSMMVVNTTHPSVHQSKREKFLEIKRIAKRANYLKKWFGQDRATTLTWACDSGLPYMVDILLPFVLDKEFHADAHWAVEYLKHTVDISHEEEEKHPWQADLTELTAVKPFVVARKKNQTIHVASAIAMLGGLGLLTKDRLNFIVAHPDAIKLFADISTYSRSDSYVAAQHLINFLFEELKDFIHQLQAKLPPEMEVKEEEEKEEKSNFIIHTGHLIPAPKKLDRNTSILKNGFSIIKKSMQEEIGGNSDPDEFDPEFLTGYLLQIYDKDMRLKNNFTETMFYSYGKYTPLSENYILHYADYTYAQDFNKITLGGPRHHSKLKLLNLAKNTAKTIENNVSVYKQISPEQIIYIKHRKLVVYNFQKNKTENKFEFAKKRTCCCQTDNEIIGKINPGYLLHNYNGITLVKLNGDLINFKLEQKILKVIPYKNDTMILIVNEKYRDWINGAKSNKAEISIQFLNFNINTNEFVITKKQSIPTGYSRQAFLVENDILLYHDQGSLYAINLTREKFNAHCIVKHHDTDYFDSITVDDKHVLTLSTYSINLTIQLSSLKQFILNEEMKTSALSSNPAMLFNASIAPVQVEQAESKTYKIK